MNIAKLTKPEYMKWSIGSIENKVKELYEELNFLVPDVEPKITYSSLDENILTESDITGVNIKRTFILKAAENGKKFEYKHTLSNDDKIEDVRKSAWKQYDAFKYNIEKKQLNKTEENGNQKINSSTSN